MDFHGMKRKNLQALCKKHNLVANGSNLEMADRLASHLKKSDLEPKPLKGLEKNDEIKDVVGSSKVVTRQAKKVRFCLEQEEEKLTQIADLKKNEDGNVVMKKKSSMKPGFEKNTQKVEEIPVRMTRSRRGAEVASLPSSPVVKKKPRRGVAVESGDEEKKEEVMSSLAPIEKKKSRGKRTKEETEDGEKETTSVVDMDDGGNSSVKGGEEIGVRVTRALRNRVVLTDGVDENLKKKDISPRKTRRQREERKGEDEVEDAATMKTTTRETRSRKRGNEQEESNTVSKPEENLEERASRRPRRHASTIDSTVASDGKNETLSKEKVAVPENEVHQDSESVPKPEKVTRLSRRNASANDESVQLDGQSRTNGVIPKGNNTLAVDHAPRRSTRSAPSMKESVPLDIIDTKKIGQSVSVTEEPPRGAQTRVSKRKSVAPINMVVEKPSRKSRQNSTNDESLPLINLEEKNGTDAKKTRSQKQQAKGTVTTESSVDKSDSIVEERPRRPTRGASRRKTVALDSVLPVSENEMKFVPEEETTGQNTEIVAAGGSDEPKTQAKRPPHQGKRGESGSKQPGKKSDIQVEVEVSTDALTDESDKLEINRIEEVPEDVNDEFLPVMGGNAVAPDSRLSEEQETDPVVFTENESSKVENVSMPLMKSELDNVRAIANVADVSHTAIELDTGDEQASQVPEEFPTLGVGGATPRGVENFSENVIDRPEKVSVSDYTSSLGETRYERNEEKVDDYTVPVGAHQEPFKELVELSPSKESSETQLSVGVEAFDEEISAFQQSDEYCHADSSLIAVPIACNQYTLSSSKDVRQGRADSSMDADNLGPHESPLYTNDESVPRIRNSAAKSNEFKETAEAKSVVNQSASGDHEVHVEGGKQLTLELDLENLGESSLVRGLQILEEKTVNVNQEESGDCDSEKLHVEVSYVVNEMKETLGALVEDSGEAPVSEAVSVMLQKSHKLIERAATAEHCVARGTSAIRTSISPFCRGYVERDDNEVAMEPEAGNLFEGENAAAATVFEDVSDNIWGNEDTPVKSSGGTRPERNPNAAEEPLHFENACNEHGEVRGSGYVQTIEAEHPKPEETAEYAALSDESSEEDQRIGVGGETKTCLQTDEHGQTDASMKHSHHAPNESSQSYSPSDVDVDKTAPAVQESCEFDNNAGSFEGDKAETFPQIPEVLFKRNGISELQGLGDTLSDVHNSQAGDPSEENILMEAISGEIDEENLLEEMANTLAFSKVDEEKFNADHVSHDNEIDTPSHVKAEEKLESDVCRINESEIRKHAAEFHQEVPEDLGKLKDSSAHAVYNEINETDAVLVEPLDFNGGNKLAEDEIDGTPPSQACTRGNTADDASAKTIDLENDAEIEEEEKELKDENLGISPFSQARNSTDIEKVAASGSSIDFENYPDTFKDGHISIKKLFEEAPTEDKCDCIGDVDVAVDEGTVGTSTLSHASSLSELIFDSESNVDIGTDGGYHKFSQNALVSASIRMKVGTQEVHAHSYVESEKHIFKSHGRIEFDLLDGKTVFEDDKDLGKSLAYTCAPSNVKDGGVMQTTDDDHLLEKNDHPSDEEDDSESLRHLFKEPVAFEEKMEMEVGNSGCKGGSSSAFVPSNMVDEKLIGTTKDDGMFEKNDHSSEEEEDVESSEDVSEELVDDSTTDEYAEPAGTEKNDCSNEEEEDVESKKHASEELVDDSTTAEYTEPAGTEKNDCLNEEEQDVESLQHVSVELDQLKSDNATAEYAEPAGTEKNDYSSEEEEDVESKQHASEELVELNSGNAIPKFSEIVETSLISASDLSNVGEEKLLESTVNHPVFESNDPSSEEESDMDSSQQFSQELDDLKFREVQGMNASYDCESGYVVAEYKEIARTSLILNDIHVNVEHVTTPEKNCCFENTGEFGVVGEHAESQQDVSKEENVGPSPFSAFFDQPNLRYGEFEYGEAPSAVRRSAKSVVVEEDEPDSLNFALSSSPTDVEGVENDVTSEEDSDFDAGRNSEKRTDAENLDHVPKELAYLRKDSVLEFSGYGHVVSPNDKENFDSNLQTAQVEYHKEASEEVFGKRPGNTVTNEVVEGHKGLNAKVDHLAASDYEDHDSVEEISDSQKTLKPVQEVCEEETEVSGTSDPSFGENRERAVFLSNKDEKYTGCSPVLPSERHSGLNEDRRYFGSEESMFHNKYLDDSDDIVGVEGSAVGDTEQVLQYQTDLEHLMEAFPEAAVDTCSYYSQGDEKHKDKSVELTSWEIDMFCEDNSGNEQPVFSQNRTGEETFEEKTREAAQEEVNKEDGNRDFVQGSNKLERKDNIVNSAVCILRLDQAELSGDEVQAKVVLSPERGSCDNLLDASLTDKDENVESSLRIHFAAKDAEVHGNSSASTPKNHDVSVKDDVVNTESSLRMLFAAEEEEIYDKASELTPRDVDVTSKDEDENMESSLRMHFAAGEAEVHKRSLELTPKNVNISTKDEEKNFESSLRMLFASGEVHGRSAVSTTKNCDISIKDEDENVESSSRMLFAAEEAEVHGDFLESTSKNCVVDDADEEDENMESSSLSLSAAEEIEVHGKLSEASSKKVDASLKDESENIESSLKVLSAAGEAAEVHGKSSDSTPKKVGGRRDSMDEISSQLTKFHITSAVKGTRFRPCTALRTPLKTPTRSSLRIQQSAVLASAMKENVVGTKIEQSANRHVERSGTKRSLQIDQSANRQLEKSVIKRRALGNLQNSTNR